MDIFLATPGIHVRLAESKNGVHGPVQGGDGSRTVSLSIDLLNMQTYLG